MHFFSTGYCMADEHHIRAGCARRKVRCHCLVAVFEHPKHGWILFDTGYAPRFLDATANFPSSLYRKILPVEISEETSIIHQLGKLGLRAADITTVIISHFHSDHVAGLHDFPSSNIVCSGAGYEHFRARTGVRALLKAYLPELVPPNLPERSQFIDKFESTTLQGLGPTFNLFGDGTVRLVSLPGHARGQIGALVDLGGAQYLLAADGCWQRKSFRQDQPPHWITHGLIDDPKQARTTLHKLREFERQNPDVIVVPTHCPEAHRELVTSNEVS